jgi:hypothetical protein
MQHTSLVDFKSISKTRVLEIQNGRVYITLHPAPSSLFQFMHFNTTWHIVFHGMPKLEANKESLNEKSVTARYGYAFSYFKKSNRRNSKTISLL